CTIECLLALASHGSLCRAEQRIFRDSFILILLLDNFILRLRTCEILATIVELRQFHSNFPIELRLAMLLEKPLSELSDSRFVSAACFFYPDAEIIAAFSGSSGGSGLNCVVQIFSRFIQAWR